MSIRKNWIVAAAGAAGLFAQQGSIGGPVAGYVFDPKMQSLRVIRGIPGASLIGDGLELGAVATSAWVAPKQDAALVVTADGAVRLFRLDGGKATPSQMDGLTVPERAVFSPSGTAMALVASGSVRVIKGLPDAPVAVGTVQLPGARRAPASAALAAGKKLMPPASGALALSDDGAYLLYSSGTSIDLLGADGNTRKLSEAASGAFVAFAPGGHDAAVVDGESVALFQDVAGASTVRRLPGIGGGKDVGFSADGRKLFVAASTVMSVDVASGERTEIACDCHPTGLARMGNAFRLNDLGTEPLWLLDATAEPRVVFVPARSGM
jgi:hypothetical protein